MTPEEELKVRQQLAYSYPKQAEVMVDVGLTVTEHDSGALIAKPDVDTKDVNYATTIIPPQQR